MGGHVTKLNVSNVMTVINSNVQANVQVTSSDVTQSVEITNSTINAHGDFIITQSVSIDIAELTKASTRSTMEANMSSDMSALVKQSGGILGGLLSNGVYSEIDTDLKEIQSQI